MLFRAVIISIIDIIFMLCFMLFLKQKNNDASLVKNQIESCVGDICCWITNDLKLNKHKSEVLDSHVSFDHHSFMCKT